MSNGSLQKVQFSEDDGRNNVAMQAALPAATNIKMMQGLEFKVRSIKGLRISIFRHSCHQVLQNRLGRTVDDLADNRTVASKDLRICQAGVTQ